MKETLQITVKEAVEKLLSGNKQYIGSKYGVGDISKEKRRLTSLHGQSPLCDHCHLLGFQSHSGTYIFCRNRGAFCDPSGRQCD